MQISDQRSQADLNLKVLFNKVAVVGSTGYSGEELLGLLKRHPIFEVVGEYSSNQKPVLDGIDLVFLCTPAEISWELAPLFLDRKIHVVDVSGAFRLKKYDYEEWYGSPHPNVQWLEKSEYGLYPWKKIEPHSPAQKPFLIANPGCFASAVSMGLAPLLKDKLIDVNKIFIDAKSGTTGAGRKAETHLLFSEIAENFFYYRVGKHQHWPEIVETLEAISGANVSPVLVNSLLPVRRGISAALYLEWDPKVALKSTQTLLDSYERHYSQYSDIVVSAQESNTALSKVVNTNNVNITVFNAFGRPVVIVTIDNLVRGAAGQALMNANQLAGLNASEGIK